MINQNGRAIHWIGNQSTQYDTGVQPAITLTDNNILVEVHKHEDKGNFQLYYCLGIIEPNNQLRWVNVGSPVSEIGKWPSVASNGQQVLFIWQKTDIIGFGYYIAELSADATMPSSSWYRGVRSTSCCKRPQIAIRKNEIIVVAGEAGKADGLIKHCGALNMAHTKIDWEKEIIEYDVGTNPTVAFNDDQLVEFHEFNSDIPRLCRGNIS